MLRNKFFIIILMIFASVPMSQADKYEDYVAEYSGIAVAEMRRSGIPASVTLAQGLLESAAGRSTLATEGNNHFGIKCHNDWRGETMLRDDDAPDECFRVYGSAAESFEDHTRFLQRKRYASLFELEPTDYKGWAYGLSRCGYATDPNYGPRLTAIIERYGLYRYDHEGGAGEIDAEFIMQTLRSTHAVSMSGGRHFVIAYPGDSYESIAGELGMDAGRLARCNGDVALTDWMEVYLQ